VTRKDYEFIATAIARLPIDGLALREVARSFSLALASENERFDRQRFLKAIWDKVPGPIEDERIERTPEDVARFRGDMARIAASRQVPVE
jgi:hypothetical protein